MPRGDRRGPDGMGPMTGRGLGYCAGYEQPGFMADAPPRGGAGYGRGYGFGRRGRMGFGYGRGRGRGWGYGYDSVPMYDAPPVEDPGDRGLDLAGELASLKEQIKALAERLEGLAKDD